jgi:two-component system sensor histidine kinase DesK
MGSESGSDNAASKRRMRAASTEGRAAVTSMRRYTAATLWCVNIAFGVTQLILAVGVPFDSRVVVLALLTVASLFTSFALTPRLLNGLGESSPWHPLVYLLIALSAATWITANVAPFAGWGWSIAVAVAAGIVACFVSFWWRFAVLIIGVAVVVTVRIVAIALAGEQFDWETFAGAEPAFFLILAVPVLIIPFTYITAVWGLDVVMRLDRARSLASELAIARERLRFATDLHDIQGHNLQVIALKSELAERLFTIDPQGAARELAQMRTIAQQALDDTRAVVNDYRTVTVAVEVRNAAAILRSAGIDCAVQVDVSEIPAATGTVLAVAVREATTNLLRHSKATTASIELVTRGADAPTGGEYRLTVVNDGASPLRSGGTGLLGLAERVETAGGTVSTRREGGTFTLEVRIPRTLSANGPHEQKGARQ